MKKHVIQTLDTILAQNGYSAEDYLEAKGYKLSNRVMPKLMTVTETARYFSCCNRHVYRLIEKGLLSPTRGVAGTRVSIEEADRFIREKCHA